jgi:hypothetical protein
MKATFTGASSGRENRSSLSASPKISLMSLGKVKFQRLVIVRRLFIFRVSGSIDINLDKGGGAARE